MKCVRCGYESPAQFTQCPSCGTVQTYAQSVNTAASPYQYNTSNAVLTRTPGETISVIVAVVVTIISIIAAFIIFVAYMTVTAANSINEQEYDIDAVDDFDSNEFDSDLEDFFKNYYNSGNEKYDSDSPADLDTPITFKETLYSFSEGDVNTEYEVKMTGTYRGAAAVKLLEGAALPAYDDVANEIYLVRFSIKITDQEKDAIVTMPTGNPAAYPTNAVSIFSSGYDTIRNLNYVNSKKLLSKNEEVDTWMAFIVSKDDESPCIRWNRSTDSVFRNSSPAISDASGVEAGAAIEKEAAAETETESAETSSD